VLLEVKVRHVRTPEGARIFKAPIGAPITTHAKLPVGPLRKRFSTAVTHAARLFKNHPPKELIKHGDKDFHVLPAHAQGPSGDGYVYGPKGEKFWGKFGASGLLVRHVDADGNETFLLARRGPALSSNVGKYSTVGGSLHRNETPEQGASREAQEEIGISGDDLARIKKSGEHVFEHPSGAKYHNLLGDVRGKRPEFDPKTFDFETDAAVWVPRSQLEKMAADGQLVPALAQELPNLLKKFPAPPKKKGAKDLPHIQLPPVVKAGPYTYKTQDGTILPLTVHPDGSSTLKMPKGDVNWDDTETAKRARYFRAAKPGGEASPVSKTSGSSGSGGAKIQAGSYTYKTQDGTILSVAVNPDGSSTLQTPKGPVTWDKAETLKRARYFKRAKEKMDLKGLPTEDLEVKVRRVKTPEGTRAFHGLITSDNTYMDGTPVRKPTPAAVPAAVKKRKFFGKA
jgi:8-oxo-dGTP pyrophosphatase MutT (NUDIX family)